MNDHYRQSMKIEEAIVYVLASSNRGMRTEQIAAAINERGLFHRKGCGHHVPSGDLRQVGWPYQALDMNPSTVSHQGDLLIAKAGSQLYTI